MPRREAVRVRVVGNPGGDNPDFVLQAWRGVEFDATPLPGDFRGANLVSGTSVSMSDPWAVDAAEAVKALEAAGQEEAVAWWKSMGYPEGGGELLFEHDSCIPVEAA